MIATLAHFAVLAAQTPTMATQTSPPDQRAPQPPLQTLSDSLRGDLHFAGDQTCVDSLEVFPVAIVDSDRFSACRFTDQSKIFNGTIRTKAIALALPEDAADISK